MDELQKEYLEKLKTVELLKNGVDIDEVETYSKYITADDKKEIEKQVAGIADDINARQYVDVSTDNSTWKPFD